MRRSKGLQLPRCTAAWYEPGRRKDAGMTDNGQENGQPERQGGGRYFAGPVFAVAPMIDWTD
jgi:hypothetical protein